MWKKFEFGKLNDKDLLDLSEHVVEINRLTTQLNHLTRQTHKPQWSDIDDTVTALRQQCSMIQRLVDVAYE
jgi:hypothetical protein